MYECWSLCLLFLSICNVIADVDTTKSDDIDEFEDNSMDGYKSHSDLKTKWQFVNRKSFPIEEAPFASATLSPSTVFYKVAIDESTSIILSLRNLGESTFNITSMSGFIHAAHRFTFYVENCTKRLLNTVLAPHNEVSFEYRFVARDGMPLVDFVFSGDIEYNLLISAHNNDDNDDNNDNNDTAAVHVDIIAYRYKFMNVTINIYDSAPMKWIDFELIFMSLSIIVFWCFVIVLFYEFWWIPNQCAQGKQPLPTQEWIMFVYDNYVKYTYYGMRHKVLNKANPMSNATATNLNNSATQKKSANHDWLSGTSASSKKKKKKRN